ncbi:MAG TPA: flagellar motor protein MotB [Pirellulales bacterium]|nr:flagellar motor protein MotB [Pirellulales bacterium]
MSSTCPECEEGLPEWIMSYADMITILMAFFVVMYSMAGNKDTAKEEAVLRSLRRNLGPFKGVFGRYVPQNSKFAELATTRAREHQPHEPSPHTPAPHVPRVPAGQPLAKGGLIYFAQGAVDLSEDNQQQLDLAVETLAGKPQRIEIRGHATNRPLPEGSPYHDHWDLAYGRCRQTMAYLVAHGIAAERIRLGVAPQAISAQAVSRPLLLVSDSWVEIYMLNEFRERREAQTDQRIEKEKLP